MDTMRLYGLRQSFESSGTAPRFGICAVLFCFATAATAGASDGSSLFHFNAGGFSYQVSLRSYERSAQQRTSETNTSPQVVSRAITVWANQDSIITLSATNADDGSVIFFLTSLPANGKLYQHAGKARGAPMQAGAAVSDAQHRVIFAPAANGSGAGYGRFNFVANDRNGISDPATVTVNVLPPEQPRFIEFTRFADGRCRLLLEGQANTAYLISASTDLVNWQDIGASSQIGLELFFYEDNEAPQFANRFYRARVSDAPPAPELTGIERQSGGNCVVTFLGGPYWPHSVWASSDLTEWKLLGPAEETAPGTFKFTDTKASSLSHRFYRASSP